ncbi:MAG TPA: hypothetical protein PL042_01730 [Caldisericia bacterium]|nr:hypothetical protein [Caldisericia bacterium]
MERNQILEKMLEITKNIETAKTNQLKVADSLSELWNKYNKIAFEVEKEVYDNKEVKMTADERAFAIKYNKQNNEELQLIMNDINIKNAEKSEVEKDLSILELQFKSYRTAYGLMVSDF